MIVPYTAPYGIRESNERVDRKNKNKKMSENAAHYPSTSKYDLSILYGDLLNFSAKHLKLGGRLVFWYPFQVTTTQYIPQHTNLKLISSSIQNLNKTLSRYLLTYEKCL